MRLIRYIKMNNCAINNVVYKHKNGDKKIMNGNLLKI